MLPRLLFTTNIYEYLRLIIFNRFLLGLRTCTDSIEQMIPYSKYRYNEKKSATINCNCKLQLIDIFIKR